MDFAIISINDLIYFFLNIVFFNILPHAILMPKYDDSSNSGQAICLAWMSSNYHRCIAAGFADG